MLPTTALLPDSSAHPSGQPARHTGQGRPAPAGAAGPGAPAGWRTKQTSSGKHRQLNWYQPRGCAWPYSSPGRPTSARVCPAHPTGKLHTALTCRTARLGAGRPRLSCGNSSLRAADSRLPPSCASAPSAPSAAAASVAAAAPSMKRESAWLAAWRSARSSAHQARRPGKGGSRRRWSGGLERRRGRSCTAAFSSHRKLLLQMQKGSATPAPHRRSAGRAGTCAAAAPPGAGSAAARRRGRGGRRRPCAAHSPARQSEGGRAVAREGNIANASRSWAVKLQDAGYAARTGKRDNTLICSHPPIGGRP